MFDKNLKQEDLAEMIGTNQQMISRWLNGVRNPSFTSLKKIAAALNVSFNYFVEAENTDKDLKKTKILKLENKILKLEKEVLNLKNKNLQLEKENLKLKLKS